MIVSTFGGDEFDATLKIILGSLKPNGKAIFLESSGSVEDPTEQLKLNGFQNPTKAAEAVIASKPNYETGSAMKLSFAKSATEKKAAAAKVWKLDDDDEEEIDEDDLLDEEDKKKPDEASLRVCGTTGKRKACKDCSCGLAEELDAEKTGGAVDTANAKSSCGSVSILIIFLVCPLISNLLSVLLRRRFPLLHLSVLGNARLQGRGENHPHRWTIES